MTSLEQLTLAAEKLLELVTDDDHDTTRDDDNVDDVLDTLRTVSSKMTGSDEELSLLAVRSIILKCVSVRLEMTRRRVKILTSLIHLHCDLVTDPDDDMIPNIVTTLQHNHVSPPAWLHILTCISNEIFLRHQVIIVTGHYWSMIQSGLMSGDSITRKRSLFMMKRSVDTMTSDLSKLEDESGLVTQQKSKSDAREFFDLFFLIYETLEEKQVHLVKQVLVKLEQLLSSSSTSSSTSWILILFLRVFQHPNISMVRWGVTAFLQTKFSRDVVTDQHFLSFICNPLLEALNETKIYSRDTEENSDNVPGEVVSDQLRQFLDSVLAVVSDDQQSSFIRTVVTAVCSSSWAPVPLTWLSFSLSHLQQEQQSLSGAELESVRSLVETGMQYQEPLLRSAAQVVSD